MSLRIPAAHSPPSTPSRNPKIFAVGPSSGSPNSRLSVRWFLSGSWMVLACPPASRSFPARISDCSRLILAPPHVKSQKWGISLPGRDVLYGRSLSLSQ